MAGLNKKEEEEKERRKRNSQRITERADQLEKDRQEINSQLKIRAWNQGADTTSADYGHRYFRNPDGTENFSWGGPRRPDFKPRVIPPVVSDSSAPAPAAPAPAAGPALPMRPVAGAPQQGTAAKPGTLSEKGRYLIIEPQHFDAILQSDPTYPSWTAEKKNRVRAYMQGLLDAGWNTDAVKALAGAQQGVMSESLSPSGEKIRVNTRLDASTMDSYSTKTFLDRAIAKYNSETPTEHERVTPNYGRQGGAVGTTEPIEVTATKRTGSATDRLEDAARRRAALAPQDIPPPENEGPGARARRDYANKLRQEAHQGYREGWKPSVGRYTPEYFKNAEGASTEAREASAYIREQVRDWNSKNPNNKMDPEAMVRLFIAESNLNPQATNKDTGAAGIAQMLPAFRKDIRTILGREIDPYNMREALWGAINLTGHYMKTYQLPFEAAIIGYHDGFPMTHFLRKESGYYGLRTATREGSEEYFRIYSGDPAAVQRLNRHGIFLHGQANPGSSTAEAMTTSSQGAQPAGDQMQPETPNQPAPQAPVGATGTPTLQEIYDRQRQSTTTGYDELEQMADELFSSNPELEKRLRAMIDAKQAEPPPAGPNPWAAAVMGFINPQTAQQYVTGKQAEVQQAQRDKKAKISEYEETILENRLKEEIARRDWTSALKTKKMLDLAAINTEQAKAEAGLLEKEAQRKATRENLQERLRSQESMVLARAQAALQNAGLKVDNEVMKQLVAIYRATAGQDEYGASVWANDPGGLATYVATQYANMLNVSQGMGNQQVQGPPQNPPPPGQSNADRLMGVFQQGPR